MAVLTEDKSIWRANEYTFVCNWFINGSVLSKLKHSYHFKQMAPYGKKNDHVLVFNATLSAAAWICAQAIKLIDKTFLVQRIALLTN